MLIYIHGGGWQTGSRTRVHAKPQHFNANGMVNSVNHPNFLLLYSSQGDAATRAKFTCNFAQTLIQHNTSVDVYDGRKYSHRQINQQIGENHHLTKVIDDFLAQQIAR